jgi:hypothetical protein
LKEEIRRHERNQQRSEAANLEYLKNVILKFLQSVEEQEQLIPVLGMLLQFSPEEMEKVKQHRASQAAKMPSAPSAFEGLTSYLQMWS